MPERRNALIAYAICFLVAATAVWLYHLAIPFSMRAAESLLEDVESFPSAFRLILGLESWLIAIPLVILLSGAASWRFAFLRNPIVIAILSSLTTAIFTLAGIALATPYYLYATLPPFTKKLETHLHKSETITIYALWQLTNGVETAESFYKYSVAGKQELSEQNMRQEVVEALIRSSHENKGQEAACFYPHHGLRAVSKGKVVDLLICFSCRKVKVLPDDEWAYMSATAMPVLDKFLEESGIPPGPHKKKKEE